MVRLPEVEIPIARKAAGSTVQLSLFANSALVGVASNTDSNATPGFRAGGCLDKKTARRSGPFHLVKYRCCSSGRTALWDFCHPCRETGSAGRVSDHRLAADRVSVPAIDSAGRVCFGSSWCFLSWEHHHNGRGFGFVPIKEKRQFALPPRYDGQPDIC